MAAFGTDALGAFGPQNIIANGGYNKSKATKDATGALRERFDVWGTQ